MNAIIVKKKKKNLLTACNFSNPNRKLSSKFFNGTTNYFPHHHYYLINAIIHNLQKLKKNTFISTGRTRLSSIYMGMFVHFGPCNCREVGHQGGE